MTSPNILQVAEPIPAIAQKAPTSTVIKATTPTERTVTSTHAAKQGSNVVKYPAKKIKAIEDFTIKAANGDGEALINLLLISHNPKVPPAIKEQVRRSISILIEKNAIPEGGLPKLSSLVIRENGRMALNEGKTEKALHLFVQAASTNGTLKKQAFLDILEYVKLAQPLTPPTINRMNLIANNLAA